MIDNTIVLGGGGTNDIVEWLEENALQKVPLTFIGSGGTVQKSFQVADVAPSSAEKWIVAVYPSQPGGAVPLAFAASVVQLSGFSELALVLNGSNIRWQASATLSGSTATITINGTLNGTQPLTVYVVSQKGTWS